MKKLLIATGNQGKLRDIKKYLEDLDYEIISLNKLNLNQDIDENGKTYKENSQKKAVFFAKLSNLPTLADDSGVEIDALGGKPGIDSRYWAKNDEEIIKKLTKLSKDLPSNNRRVTFKSVISLALPNGKVWSAGGKVEGIIAEKENGKRDKGYPYRSFFYLPKIKKYHDEEKLTEDEQRLYNHRYKAIQKIKKIIAKEIKF
ncbi:MAG: non-canonical purine NTP pyrophosphatase [Candidatus Levybacteria bacterium CG_4_10_14_0_8_um_filter_35_23]|nr:MAG: non-canonical purine NTP pyrophosphatase [Candidatus Levybacteria bacterium CG_4_10_14_0_8_um_filter_35_23]